MPLTKAQKAAIMDRAKLIEALATNPRWSTERRWRIAELAQELQQYLNAVDVAD